MGDATDMQHDTEEGPGGNAQSDKKKKLEEMPQSDQKKGLEDATIRLEEGSGGDATVS